MSFKKGTRVEWRSPRSNRKGVGKIKEILTTVKGAWYEVEDEASKTRIRLRAANLIVAQA